MKHAPVDLSNKGTTLGSLKEIVRRCDLMVTNDTGPRHIAAAIGRAGRHRLRPHASRSGPRSITRRNGRSR